MPLRLKSILVACDLSEGANEVLRSAGALAALAGAELHVVHALEASASPGAGGPSADDPFQTAAGLLRERVRQAIADSAEVASSHIAAGHAHEVILQEAAVVGADLIVIGPHRERPEGHRALGTTADRLVRTSEVPCLIVRGPVSLPLRRVLIPTDLSDSARGALDLALIWGAALRMPTASGEVTRLDVLHVLPRGAARAADSRADSAVEGELRDEVAAASDRTGCASRLRIDPMVIEGDGPADAILGYTKENRVDLLVMGTHGQSALERTLMGSVSSVAARLAECPVLLVPPALWKARQDREEQIRPGG